MKKLLFIGLILISLICLYAHSEDFVIGNYSYLKPHQSFFNDMADKMEEANFNMTIWEPSNSSTATNDKINTLYDYSIDSYLYDQITNFDNNGDISGISQEFYLGYRVVTWEEIEGLDFSIIRNDDGVEILILEGSGEVVVVKYEK